MKSTNPGGRAALLLILLSMSAAVTAQTSSRPKSRNIPLWAKMMNDPHANYYTAKKDYDSFWKGKEKPADEEELMSKSTEAAKEHIKKPTKKEIREQLDMDYYRYQCKRFEHWLLENKPYVQKDGRILTADERLQLWEQTQKGKQ